MTGVTRVAIDSNILISAARGAKSRLLPLWNLPSVDVLVTQFVVSESMKHLIAAEQKARLWHLLYESHLIPDGGEVVLPAYVDLPAKDQPVLQGAIAGKADFLVTGDIRHFSPLFGKIIEGVLVESTAMFRARHSDYF